MRFNQEVQFADEDYQLGIFTELANAGALALSRALDLGLYHRINPLTGQVISSWTNYLTATSKNVVQNTADADADLRAAVGLLMNSQPSFGVNGAAIDPKFAWALSELKVTWLVRTRSLCAWRSSTAGTCSLSVSRW